MRRNKGTGSIVLRQGKFHARRRKNGLDEYGPARLTRDEAEADRLVWARDQAATIVPKSEIPALGQFAMDLMGEDGRGAYGRTLAPSTFDLVENIRTVHLSPAPIALKRLDRVSHDDVQAWVDALRSKRVSGRGKDRTVTYVPASPSSQHRCLAYLAKVLEYAVDQGLISRNPARKTVLPHIHERENRVLEPEEVRGLLSPTTRTDAALLLATHGLRRGEVCRVQWSDIDEKGSRVRVRQTKGARAFRWVPIMPECLAALLAQPRRCEYVFSTETREPLDAHNLTRDFRRRKAALGIPQETRLQDLRGTFVTLLLDQGVDLRTVMELAGHKKAETTLKAYARARSATKNAAIAQFGLLVRGRTSGAVSSVPGYPSAPVDPSRESGRMVGGTGFEPVTPTVSLEETRVLRLKRGRTG